MDLIGIGTEIVECLRMGRLIEQHGEQFVSRVFTPAEIQFCRARKRTTEHFAALWAAKEAALKALAIAWNTSLSWTDIEVRTEAPGCHEVRLTGAIRELAEARALGKILLSTSHCRAYAVAHAVALRGT